MQFDRSSAGFGGTLHGAAINSLHASGPWGTFAGSGGFSPQRFVAYGKYRGTFEGLQPFLGKRDTGHGGYRRNRRIAVEPQRILVQGSNLAMHRATLRGVPIDARASRSPLKEDRCDLLVRTRAPRAATSSPPGRSRLAPPHPAAGGRGRSP